MKNKYSKDLQGLRIGRLVVLSPDRLSPKGQYWLCQCDCGNKKSIRCDALINEKTRSCGCLSKERVRERATKHGMCNSKLYSVFYEMHQRCENPKSSSYSYYGERGISVCDDWSGKNGFISFYTWSKNNGYREGLTLDRIDVNDGYAPGNCRWATREEQQQNLRCTLRVFCDGECITLKEASKKYGISRKIIYDRMRRGWDDERAVKTPIQTKYINRRFK